MYFILLANLLSRVQVVKRIKFTHVSVIEITSLAIIVNNKLIMNV